jgi:hypothetical protein
MMKAIGQRHRPASGDLQRVGATRYDRHVGIATVASISVAPPVLKTICEAAPTLIVSVPVLAEIFRPGWLGLLRQFGKI